MIAPHVKSLGGQARNISYLASMFCQHCQKRTQFLESSSMNASNFSGLSTNFPPYDPKSSPNCTSFGMQTIRHISKPEHPDRNESQDNQNIPSTEKNKDNINEIQNQTPEKMEGLLLETLTENRETVKCVPVVPGKGPPPDPPLDCCMSGCANCVWIKYAEEMRDYYCEGGIEKALKDIEHIQDANLKAYLKLELSFINK